MNRHYFQALQAEEHRKQALLDEIMQLEACIQVSHGINLAVVKVSRSHQRYSPQTLEAKHGDNVSKENERRQEELRLWRAQNTRLQAFLDDVALKRAPASVPPQRLTSHVSTGSSEV